MERSFNTPYKARYIGTAPLTKSEPQIIQIKDNKPYGVKVVAEDTEIPYASINGVIQSWEFIDK